MKIFSLSYIKRSIFNKMTDSIVIDVPITEMKLQIQLSNKNVTHVME